MPFALRWGLLAAAATATLMGAWLFAVLAAYDGWSPLDTLRLILSSLCIFWLAWGAGAGLMGLVTHGDRRESKAPLLHRTAILVPIYNEDPLSTFARVAAMSARLTAIGAHEKFDIFILSDSQSLEAAARETLWFERLLTDSAAREHIFYRRRTPNVGRKAGNVEEFIRRSGGAYTYALVLDADSLMEAETIVSLVRRMDAEPRLGLLQTLPRIVHARSIFGRAIQFAVQLYSPAFANGAVHLQGAEGPYWGHNAIFRVKAFAQCCGLPALSGKPPFGGHILSHDYVEAALLARRGWQVRLDADLNGSYEEGPDNIVDFAKRDQRWCQGNLQHIRVLFAPALKAWNRVTLLQGIVSYLMPPLWLLLLVVNIVAVDIARHPRPFRPGPDWAGWALIGFVVTLLILPKLLIGLATILRERADVRTGLVILTSQLAEIALSTLLAPIALMYGVRAFFRVLLGRDGGWPATNRADSSITLGHAWDTSWWITGTGVVGLALVVALASAATIWCLPVALPMIFAPLIIVWSNRPVVGSWLWAVPSETSPTPVLVEYAAILSAWTGSATALLDDYAEVADVVG